ncbi:MAG: N-acetylmuramoyl-L-alanine amidase [Bacillota bacterium]
MPISRATKVVGVGPDLSRERFIQVLQEAGSPAAPEAGAGYDEVVKRRVSPAFALAIFRHESRFGLVGIVPQYDLKNPGATRSTRTGVGTVVEIPGRGPFVRYPSWTAGWADLAERLVDPTYAYARAGAVTIEQIIPIWAPATDGNSPESYIQAVVASMESFLKEGKVSIQIPGLPVRVSHIPRGNPNRPGYPMTPQGIVIHETANRNVGANAEAHRRFTHQGGGPEQVSFHWVVDSTEAIQLLPHSENAWHGGDGAQGRCNRTRIAIELCVNADGDWGRTLEHGARLVAHLCREYGWGVERVEQHYNCSGKNCPATLRQGGWEPWLRQVEQFLRGEEPRPHAIYFPETGHWIAHGFKAYWEANGGIRVLGLPLTEEFRATDTGLVTQVFERYVLEWDPSAPPDWQVRGRHLKGLDLERIVPAEAWQPRPA